METTSQARSKAADYLQELADATDEEWLRILIDCVIAARACPKPAMMDRIFDCFLAKYGLGDGISTKLPIPAPPSQTEPRRGFLLKTVKHGTGVNALKDGAELHLHPKLTVVFGKNGSGKSGFVRILKRLAGSKTQEEIWQNVRKTKSRNQCSARITYSHGHGDLVYDWAGQSSVAPFRDVGIFDGKCVSIHLTKSLSFAYQPFGFELFQATTEALRDLQERLDRAIRSERNEQPALAFCSPNTEAGRFLARVNGKTSQEELDKAANWSSESQRQLADLIKRKAGLQNLDAQKELLSTRLAKLTMLEETLRAIATDLSKRNLKAYAALATRLARLKAKQVEKKGKTLEDYTIAERDSDEWESFIAAGEEYINLAEHDKYPHSDDQCIYCQQRLSKTAHKLIELYRALYRSEEASDIDEVQDRLNEAVEELEAASYLDDFAYEKADFAKVLPPATATKAFAAMAAADRLAHLAAQILSGTSQEELQPLNLAGLLESLSSAKEKVSAEVRATAESQRTIRQQSAEFDKAILNLQDTQKLSKNRSEVEAYIAAERWIAAATPLAVKLRTKAVTDLGKRAWEELVSKAFRERFVTECTALQTPMVSLAFRGEYGSQIRDKTVEGLTQIEDLLSEGEQKAVALADFFADQGMQQENFPIIFDDPANSFDHDRKFRIAKRIVQASSQRQVIVFTHDLMFASYLYGEVENPKNRELDPDKAAFHDVRAEGRTPGLITRDYYPGAIKFDPSIKRIEARLPELATLSGAKRADAIATTYSLLRRAVEKAVEERIFGRVISRWTDQIQLYNVGQATLDRAKLDRAKELHEDFSRYIEAHNQSDEMIQHSLPDLEQLKADIAEVKQIGARK